MYFLDHQLRITAAIIRNSSKKAPQNLKEVDEILKVFNEDQLAGNQVDPLRCQYQEIYKRMIIWPDLLEQLSTQLEKIARELEEVDRSLLG